MEFETIRLEIKDAVARITLNRPKAYNALNAQMFDELLDAVSHCDASPDVRAVVLTGAGKAFCSGGDLAAFRSAGDGASLSSKRGISLAHVTISRIARMSKPVIARINGAVAGGGMGLAVAADLAVAAESAKFNLAYTSIGVSPDLGTSFFLPRLIGLRRAMELVLLNRVLSAAEALEWGLVSRVVPDDALDAEVDKLAGKLVHGPTQAFAAAKCLFYESFDNSLETQMEHEAASFIEMTQTPNFREGLDAFFEKRRPNFK